MKKTLLTILFMFFLAISEEQEISEQKFLEICNIQNPTQKEDCIEPSSKKNPNGDKACCFERFRINKIVTTRCSYINFNEDSINKEKKFLRDTWGVKNLTILCSGQKLKFKYFFLLFEFFVLILI